MRVLEGRRIRLEERLEKMHASLARTRERLDGYTLELQRHGMESVEREVRWLNELIESERTGRDQRRSSPHSSTQQDSTSGETGGLPRHRGTEPSGGTSPGTSTPPDPSDDTAK
jgi:hypothetical protein